MGLERTSREAELGRQAQSSLPAAIHHLMGAALEGDVTLAFFCRSKSRQLAAEGHPLGPVQGVGEEVSHFQRTIRVVYKCLKLPVRSTLRSLSVCCLSVHPASQPSASLVLEWDSLLQKHVLCVFPSTPSAFEGCCQASFCSQVSLTQTSLRTTCRLVKWIVPFSRPQANALRSEFYFVGCQDGSHALKIFLLYLRIYFVHVGACGGQRRTCGPRLGGRHPELFCWRHPFMPVIWLFHLPVMFSSLYPLFYNVFINPLRIPTMHFDHILFPLPQLFPDCPFAFYPPSFTFFPLKDSLFCLCKSQFLEIYDL